MIILVTGATGFIGQYLCRTLVTNGNVVYAIKKTETKLDDNLKVNWIDWDMAKSLIPDIFPKKLDVIIHLAQSSKFKDNTVGFRDMVDINVISTFNLLEYARNVGIKKFVYASTGAVYGITQEKALSEKDVLSEPNTLGFYATTKYVSEALLKNYNQFFKTSILRIFFAYGVNQQPDRLIPRLITNVKRGNAIQLEGEGLLINPIYVEDLVEAVYRNLSLDFHTTLNIAGPEILTLKEICNKIGRIVGINPKFEKIEHSTQKALLGNIDWMKEILSFSPATTIDQVLEKMVSIYG